MIADYNAREFRRNEWQAFKAIQTRLANQQTVTNGRQQTIAAVGNLQASPVDDYLDRQRQNNPEGLAILGQMNRLVTHPETPQRTAHFGDMSSPNSLYSPINNTQNDSQNDESSLAASINFHSTNSNYESTGHVRTYASRQAPVNTQRTSISSLAGNSSQGNNSQPTNSQANSTAGQSSGRGRSRGGGRGRGRGQANRNNGNSGNNNNNNNPNGGTNNDNPLEESTITVMPMNMWGDPRAELGMKGLLQMAKDAGWEHSLFRKRLDWCKTIEDQVFEVGGPLHGYVLFTICYIFTVYSCFTIHIGTDRAKDMA